jgi:hypothetical protein
VGSVTITQERDQSIQKAPPSKNRLKEFPQWNKKLPQRIWRTARTAHQDPWWWSGNGCGRFDLTAGGQGTIYLSCDRFGGLFESIGPEMSEGTIHIDELRCRRVYGLESTYVSEYRLADVNSMAAIGFGVTNEISSMTPYAMPQKWAAKFYSADFNGIIYRTRFDTRIPACGLALFGLTGSNPLNWPIGVSYPATSLRNQLKEKFGIDTIDETAMTELPRAKSNHAIKKMIQIQ